MFNIRKNPSRKILVNPNENANSYKNRRILKNPETIVTTLLIISEAITFAKNIMDIIRMRNEEDEFYEDDDSPWII